MPSDSTTTIEALKQALKQFRDKRDWRQFHNPKNLAEAISIEASELLELFLWKGVAEVERSMKSDPHFRKALEEELADVVCFTLNLANVINVDVASAVMEKIKANKRKYPVEKAKGRSTKYTEL
jgi:NTP pyrophosphatase (non-canonical NTP hydrolase)